MFAVVRTGGKQYRVAAGDKIAVEKLAGEAGDKITLGDVLLAGDAGEIKDAAGVVVSAEIIAQAKSEKVIVFKKRRRHNYRRKKGHRQQHTILRILSIGGEGAKAAPKKVVKEADSAPAPEAKKTAPRKDDSAEPAAAQAHVEAPLKVEGAESQMTDTPTPAKRPRKAAKSGDEDTKKA